MVTTYLLFIVAYLLGSIPFALVVGKIGYGIDIREHGSGNLGGTNTFRTLGKKAGFTVTIADILKGTLATSLPMIFGLDIHPLWFGLAAVLGHVYQSSRNSAVVKQLQLLLGCYYAIHQLFCNIGCCIFHPFIYNKIRITFFYGNSSCCCYCIHC